MGGRRRSPGPSGRAPKLLIHGILLPAAVALLPVRSVRFCSCPWLAGGAPFGCGWPAVGAGLALFGLYQTQVVEPQWRQAGWSGDAALP